MSGTRKKTALKEALRVLATRRFAAADGELCEVVPHIFIGSIGAAENLPELRRLGVTHIICAASNLTPKFPEEFKYLSFNLLDNGSSRLDSCFEPCFKFIEESLVLRSCVTPHTKTELNPAAQEHSKGGVLIHCFQGKSRSVALLVAYLMKSQNIPFLTALDLVREKRPIAQPNPNFALQLRAFERDLLEK